MLDLSGKECIIENGFGGSQSTESGAEGMQSFEANKEMGKKYPDWFVIIAVFSIVVIAAVVVGTAANTAFELINVSTQVKIAAGNFNPQFGKVTGIIYSEDKRSIMIDGRIFHAGDTVQGAKVLKIDRRQVDFEKNGLRWTQEVNQPPAQHWE